MSTGGARPTPPTLKNGKVPATSSSVIVQVAGVAWARDAASASVAMTNVRFRLRIVDPLVGLRLVSRLLLLRQREHVLLAHEDPILDVLCCGEVAGLADLDGHGQVLAPGVDGGQVAALVLQHELV